MRIDMVKAMNISNEDYSFSLGMRYVFERDLPLTAKKTATIFYKKLNLTRSDDCSTKQELLAFT